MMSRTARTSLRLLGVFIAASSLDVAAQQAPAIPVTAKPSASMTVSPPPSGGPWVGTLTETMKRTYRDPDHTIDYFSLWIGTTSGQGRLDDRGGLNWTIPVAVTGYSKWEDRYGGTCPRTEIQESGDVEATQVSPQTIGVSAFVNTVTAGFDPNVSKPDTYDVSGPGTSTMGTYTVTTCNSPPFTTAAHTAIWGNDFSLSPGLPYDPLALRLDHEETFRTTVGGMVTDIRLTWHLALAPDADGDGRANELDNCPALANPGQEDADRNGVGDACDSTPGLRVIEVDASVTDSSGRISTDPARPVNSPAPGARAIAADGTAKLVLMVDADAPVAFSLAADGSDGTLGSLSNPDARQTSLTATAVIGPDGRKRVMAIYTAPDSFRKAGDPQAVTAERSRQLTIAAGARNIQLLLVRPPVVLVHGIWSNAGTWTDAFKGVLNDAGFKLFLADYSKDGGSAKSFDPTIASRPGIDAVNLAIADALGDYESRGIVVRRVDAVGHSMGGLQLRGALQNGSPAIHRLITIGTPHDGTPIADALWAHAGEVYLLCTPIAPICTFVSLSFVLGHAGMRLDTGVEALQPGSAAYSHLRATRVPAHAIAAWWGSADSDSYNAFDVVLRTALGEPLDQIYADKMHDLIVPVASKLGGLPEANVTRIDNTIHSANILSKAHLKDEETETANTVIASTIVGLLTTFNPAEWADGFAAPRPLASVMSAAAPDARATAPAARATVAVGQLVIVAPAAGAKVTAAEGLQLTIAAKYTGSAPPSTVSFIVKGIGITTATAPGYTATIGIPASTPLGPLDIVALARESSGGLVASTVTVMLDGGATPVALTATPGNLLLRPGGSASLSVAGLFPSDAALVAERDVTQYLTTFATSKGATVVSVTPAGLVTAVAAGNDVITVTHQGVTTTVPVTVAGEAIVVVPAPAGLPQLSLDRSALAFGAGSVGGESVTTSAQTVRISQSGTGSPTWTAASDQPWLVLSPSSGTGAAALSVSVQPGAALSTTQTATVTLAFTGAAASGATFTVRLDKFAAASTRAAFGSFDTPTEGSSGLAGSIAVTGWSLDDVETTEVQLWRDPHASDPAGAIFGGTGPQGGKVFVGYAAFVEGARPDVQAAYATMPLSQRAGWGYLMLTRGMPWDGKGAFTLYAIAADREGHLTQLGSKTISINNAASVKPFGSIDTPGQGATASGTYPNTGWVLTPNAGATIPAANVQVAIDGVFLAGVPSMSDRSDISGGFAAFNTSGAGRGLFIDTTKYAEGAHTIGWLVTDSIGQADGVGSRFFIVANGVSSVTTSELSSLTPDGASAAVAGSQVIAAPRVSLDLTPQAVNALSESAAPLSGRRGFDQDRPLTQLRAPGIRPALQAEELDRVEIVLDDENDAFTGYVRVGDTLAALPIGSHLEDGRFTWQAGAGFVGAYDLVFVRWHNAVAADRTEVRVVLHPHGALAHALATIDTPRAEQTVEGTFTIAGWAADPSAATGTGIDAIHVWAYPVDGASPRFLGAATLGGERPDVSALHGARFLPSGYGITVSGLAPGTYDLAVFAWSHAEGRFLPARVVRITQRPPE